MYDLINILEINNYSPLEIVELLNNIDRNDIEDYAIENGICPKCLSEVVIHVWKEARGEAWGVPVEEEMSEFLCEGCGRAYPE